MGAERSITLHNAHAKGQVRGRRLDLAVCDIEMPEMNGYEFVRKVRFGAVAGYKELPVIMLTGKDTDKNVQSARIHKIDGFLVKPAKAEPLKAAIRRVLDR